jgi:YVTN family beta-propeller protein
MRRSALGLALTLAASLGASSAGAEPFVYVTNEHSGTVTVIDAATDKPLVHLKTGGRPRGIQLSADGKTVFVARCDPEFRKQNAIDAILAIDVAKRRVTAHYDGGSDPEQFAVGLDGRLYVANEDAGTASVTHLGKKRVEAGDGSTSPRRPATRSR